MGYNKTPKSVLRVREYLELLCTASGIVTLSTKDPKALAYAIHEGLYAAEFLRWPKYSQLRKSYEITTDTGKVICKPKITLTLQEGTLSLEEVTDWMDAIANIVKYKDVEIPILLPNLAYNEDDFQLLKGWCEQNGRELVKLPIGCKILKAPTLLKDEESDHGNT